MNAADYYGLEELRRACAGFVQCCINVDTVCALLASAEKYIQYKCTKSLVQKVLEFVDEHGNEVLNLGSFTLLPQHVVRLILAREELRADEFTKFQAALMWSKKYCDNNPVSTPVKSVPLGGAGAAVLAMTIKINEPVFLPEHTAEGSDRQLSGVHSIP